MTHTVEALEIEVLKLSTRERSRLLERVLASLDGDEGIDAAWDALADEREAQLLSGAAVAAPLQEAIARLEARFPG